MIAARALGVTLLSGAERELGMERAGPQGLGSGMASTSVSETDPLVAGRLALRAAAWDEARARFEEAAETSDAPEAWEGLSRSSWWLGDQEGTLATRERAYRAYLEGLHLATIRGECSRSREAIPHGHGIPTD